MQQSTRSAEAIINEAALQLEGIHRAKHFVLWRDENAQRLGGELAALAPFSTYRDLWIHTGDGGSVIATAGFGGWLIGQLLSKRTYAEIVDALERQGRDNVGRYTEVTPILGVSIDAPCDLGGGVRIVPEPEDPLARVMHRPQVRWPEIAPGTAMLRQRYEVLPAFEHRSVGDRACPGTSVTMPGSSERQTVRERVRLACIVAGHGAVELPLTVIEPDQEALFVEGAGNQASRPYAPIPLVAEPVLSDVVRTAYLGLARFGELDSLTRAVDRLGRSRLALSPVDRALDLGMAAEIALMHGAGEGNAEITHKISTRAAWLVGEDLAGREAVFAGVKRLYSARSKAVHTGALPANTKVDLAAADALVARVLREILSRGAFPDWSQLTLGGGSAEAGADEA